MSGSLIASDVCANVVSGGGNGNKNDVKKQMFHTDPIKFAFSSLSNNSEGTADIGILKSLPSLKPLFREGRQQIPPDIWATMTRRDRKLYLAAQKPKP